MVAGSVNPDAAIRWAKKLEERSAGKLKVTVFPGTMAKSEEYYDVVKNGIADVVQMADFWSGGRFPIICGIGSLPFEIKSPRAFSAVLDELYSKGLLKELDNFKLLYFNTLPTFQLFFKNKVTSIDNFAGLKIIAGGGAQSDIVKALGATPVTVPGADYYMTLEKGIAQGLNCSSDAVVARKLYEVTTCVAKFPLTISTFVFLMNKNTWNKLPPDIQALIDQLNKEEKEIFLTDVTRIDSESWALIEKKIEVYSLSQEEQTRWTKAVANVTDNWIKNMESQGLPGQQSVDTMRAVVKKFQQ
jgi:TRAP-type C4-dicarboxylate transport system substrate-binding protein